MMRQTGDFEKELSSAFSRVKREFPFDGVISDSTYYSVRAVLRVLKRYLPDFKDRRLLDIGCGPMSKTGVFQEMGFACYGADDLGDPWHRRGDNTEQIKNFAKRLGMVFHQQSEKDYAIPFDEGSFDVVCSLAVIEHLHESPRGILNTMGTHCKEGGLLVITMPNSVNLRKRLSELRGRTIYPPIDQFYHSSATWRGHVREYTLAEMEYICRQNGFEIVSSTSYEHLAQINLRLPLRQIYMAIGSLVPTTRSSLLVVCRKPEDWKPVSFNEGKFRAASAKSVPKGVA